MKKKPKGKSYNTVGVRFLDGLNVAKVYTYRVRKQVTLGQELVADTARGPVLVAVVRLDKVPQDNDPTIVYRDITRKVVPL